MVALFDGQAAGYRLVSSFDIDETRVGTLLAEPACSPALEGDYGVAVGDDYTLRSIFTHFKPYCLKMIKQH